MPPLPTGATLKAMAVSTQDVPRQSVKDWKETRKDIQAYLRADKESRNPKDLIAVLTHKEIVDEYLQQLKAHFNEEMTLKMECTASCLEVFQELVDEAVDVQRMIESHKYIPDFNALKDFFRTVPTLFLDMTQDQQFLEDVREEHKKKIEDLDDRIDDVFVSLKRSRDIILRD
ncbi:MAG: hypothetical protein Q9224_003652, partial [Gallowayella concinna]